MATIVKSPKTVHAYRLAKQSSFPRHIISEKQPMTREDFDKMIRSRAKTALSRPGMTIDELSSRLEEKYGFTL